MKIELYGGGTEHSPLSLLEEAGNDETNNKITVLSPADPLHAW